MLFVREFSWVPFSDITLSYLGQVERGERGATIDTLDKIATSLDIKNMECLKWAESAYEYYKDYLSDKTGSYDFWRQLVVSYRKMSGIEA